jgi:CubicO group peptidase (beta-lactamase class C family)
MPLNGPELERFAEGVFAPYLREFPQPSLAVAIVHGESFVWTKGYGLERAQNQRAVDPDETLFNIASVSKLVTATAVMQLVERGAIAPDEEIRHRLGADIIRGNRGAVTLRHLLTHTSGLDGAFIVRDVVADPQDLVPLRDYFRHFPPVASRAPGGEIRYSNVGMALAGRLVEEASGLRFEDYVEQRVFVPLGMQHSSFRQPPPDRLRERVATYGSGPVPDALLLAPVGAMVSTASDMARFMRMHLGYGTRILSDDTLRMMHQVQWQASPQSPGAALGFFTTDLGGPSGLFHTGARVHFSLLYLDPADRLGVFVVHAMRQGGPHQSLRPAFVGALLAKYFHTSPSPVVAVPRRESWPPLERYAGLYRPILFSTATIERAAMLAMDTSVTVQGGALAVAIPSLPRLVLRRVDAHHFRVNGGTEDGLHLAFTSSNGRITGFAMSGNTQDPVSFERLRWFESGRLHAGLLASIVLLLASAPAGSAVGVIMSRFRRGQTSGWSASRAERWAWRTAVVAGALTVAAPLTTVGFVMLHAGEDTAVDALRTALTAGATLELIALMPALAIPAISFAAWRRGFWSRWRRIYYTAIGVGVMVAIPLLYHYRLLGYHF